jgi:hypothetical protein
MNENNETAVPLDREALKAHARAKAFDTGRDCEHCDGEGKVYPGRRVIHTRLGGSGADWDEDAICRAIDEAADLQWGRGLFGPFLAVTNTDGKTLLVEIPPMDNEVPA